jgi:hypothetical protein
MIIICFLAGCGLCVVLDECFVFHLDLAGRFTHIFCITDPQASDCALGYSDFDVF